MDRAEVSLGATMGVGVIQGFTTFAGSVSTIDMLDTPSYQRNIGLALGWTFLISTAVGMFARSYAPLAAWVIVSGAMIGAYEYQRDRVANGEG